MADDVHYSDLEREEQGLNLARVSSMPILEPVEPRSAEEPTACGHVTDRRHNRRFNPQYQNMNDDHASYGEEPTNDSSRRVNEHLQQPAESSRRSVVINGAQRTGRSQESCRLLRDENFGLQRHTEEKASRNMISDQIRDFIDTHRKSPGVVKNDRTFIGDRRYRSRRDFDESEYETVDALSSNESDVQAVHRSVQRYRRAEVNTQSKPSQLGGNGDFRDDERRDRHGCKDFEVHNRPIVRKRQKERNLKPRMQCMSGVSSDGEDVIAPRKGWIKPAKFDGSGSFETFYAQFQNCAEYNGWNSLDRLAHLKACLVGEAGQVLWDSSPEATNTLSKLTALLKNRFGGSSQADKYRMELRLRRRRQGENMSTLHRDIRRLMALAHPNLPQTARESIACDYFIDSLNDADFSLKVRERNPATLDEALLVALQLEAWHQDADRLRLEEAGRQRSKQARGVAADVVKDYEGFVKRTELQDRLKQLENNIQQQLNDFLKVVSVNSQQAKTSVVSQSVNEPVGLRLSNGNQSSARRPSGCWNCGDPSHRRKDCTSPTMRRGLAPVSEVHTSLNPGYANNRSSAANRLAVGLDNADVYIRVELNGKTLPCLVDSGCEISLVPHHIVTTCRNLKLNPSTQRIFAANGTEIEVIGEVVLPMMLNGRQVDTPALVSSDVEEIMLGVDWLKSHSCVWDFGQSRIQVDGLTVIPLSVRKTVQCRRVYAARDVVLQPKQQIEVEARATITSPRRVKSDWALESRQIHDGVYVARTLLPEVHRGLLVRMVNTRNEPDVLRKGTFLGSMIPANVVQIDEVQSEMIGETTEPVSSQAVVSSTIDGLLQCMSDDLVTEEVQQVRSLLVQYSDILSLNEYDVGRTTLVEQSIDTGDHRPIRQALRRHPQAHLQAIDDQVEEMRQHGLIEPAASPWASNVVLVRKKDGSLRFCVDYRSLNSVTYKDTYPLPHIDTCLDALSGCSWFTTLDLRSGYHNIPIRNQDKDKTAFITRRGCWRYNVMPFGLTCAPSVFQRLMDLVLCGLTFEICMVYLDDIIVFSSNFSSHLTRLEQVFSRLRQANLKVKPSKCRLFQRRVEFLGHVVSATGIEMQAEKVSVVREWPVPQNLHEVRSFLGLCSYYRKFIAGFANIAAPLHELMKKNTSFVWSGLQQQAFDQLKVSLTTAPILGIPRDEGTFFLDTDASDQGLGAVLSQTQDNVERVIAYASRALSAAEKNYCTTRKELLAVVYGLKQYRQYLLGRQFVIRTDHSALQWLQRTPEPMAQQARWVAYMEQFQYSIQHRPGVRHGHADALSRRPQSCRNCSLYKSEELLSLPSRPEDGQQVLLAAAVRRESTTILQSRQAQSNEQTTSNRCEKQQTKETSFAETHLLEGESLTKAQQQDGEIGCIVQWRLKQDTSPTIDLLLAESEETKILWSQWFRLVVKDGVVYRKVEINDNSTLQLLVPRCMRSSMLLHCHTGMCGGHLGFKKTLEQVRRRAFWIGWRGDVRRFCQRCADCNSYYRGKLPKSASLQPIIPGAPFERLSIDLTGPHVRSTKGAMYILTCVDPFTKWVEAFPLPNKEAVTVAKVLVEQVFCRFGVPIALLSDRGKEVDGRIMNEICKLLGIDKMRTTSYKPSTNAAIERFHRTLNGMLGRVVSENQKDWDLWLPYVMAAYRSSQNESTLYSPNYLTLGREVRAPVDVVLGTECDQISETKYDDFVERLKDRMHGAFDVVRKQLGQAAIRNKKYYNLRVKPALYRVGDLVYYYNPRRTRGLQEKWQRKFTGPFEVVELLGPVNLLIRRSPRARPFVVHMDKVKPFNASRKIEEIPERFNVTTNLCTDYSMDHGVCRDVVDGQVEPMYDPYGVTPVGSQRPRRQIRRPKRFED